MNISSHIDGSKETHSDINSFRGPDSTCVRDIGCVEYIYLRGSLPESKCVANPPTSSVLAMHTSLLVLVPIPCPDMFGFV